MEELETIIFEIITNAGVAKGLVYEAMNESSKKNYEKTQELLKEADSYLLKAHNIQTDLIQEEAKGNNINVSVLFVHAQDHLMTAIEVRSLADTIINMNKKINELDKRLCMQ
ncbi:PTS lactose/cellobiose transporter subunit IIA [Caviibacter abscessus]|uniref:PTS lactose/cellobiose transporter subunit IIA n=1 Tax=Caviibacter abscessus TaxID=1766719 RepID=UPI00082CFC16|nr:PTS lactose/cellobiose transporter subunit IIA [Caviibacter abscessus]